MQSASFQCPYECCQPRFRSSLGLLMATLVMLLEQAGNSSTPQMIPPAYYLIDFHLHLPMSEDSQDALLTL